jgi:hypothetical protein
MNNLLDILEVVHSIEHRQLLQSCHNGTRVLSKLSLDHALTDTGFHIGIQLPRRAITESLSTSSFEDHTSSNFLRPYYLRAQLIPSLPESPRILLRNRQPTLLPHNGQILHLPPRKSRLPTQQNCHSNNGRALRNEDRERAAAAKR